MPSQGIGAESALTGRMIGAAIDVHRALGPGLLESADEACLCHELAKLGIRLRRHVPVPISYKGVELDCGYRADILVEDSLLLEIKSIEKLLPIHEAQISTYLRIAKLKTGLLINYNVRLLRDGIRRLVL